MSVSIGFYNRHLNSLRSFRRYSYPLLLVGGALMLLALLGAHHVGVASKSDTRSLFVYSGAIIASLGFELFCGLAIAIRRFSHKYEPSVRSSALSGEDGVSYGTPGKNARAFRKVLILELLCGWASFAGGAILLGANDEILPAYFFLIGGFAVVIHWTAFHRKLDAITNRTSKGRPITE